MTNSPAGQVLLEHDRIMTALKARLGPRPTLDQILVECRQLYELAKVAHHDGRFTFEHLEKIRKALEACEAGAELRKAATIMTPPKEKTNAQT